MKTTIALLWLWLYVVFAVHGRAWTHRADLAAMMLLIAAAVALARRRGLPLPAVGFALAALIGSPAVVLQIDVVPTAINCLAVLAALAIDYDIAAVLAAVVLVNGGSLLFAIALLLLVRRAWTLVALIPAIAWLWHIHWRPPISEWLAQPWSDFFRHPLDNALLPFASAHIGLHVALLDLLALAGWPLLVACAAALWAVRDDIPRGRRTASIAVLAAAFVALQLVTAPFDAPNDPTHAFPAFVAIGIAWSWAAARLWPRRAWRMAVVAVFTVSALAAFVMLDPSIAYTSTAHSIDSNPKEPVKIMERWISPGPDPHLEMH